MPGSLQREWLTDILESAPSLVFLALLRSGINIEAAGWTGAALAAFVLIGFRLYRVRFNPILLGINIHLLIITPLIVTVFELGAPELGNTLVAYSHKAVLITIFLVGCALALLSREGFAGFEGLSPLTVRTYSAILLAASLAAIAWSFTFAEGAIVGIAVPIIALFGLRRLLIARWLDSNKQINGLIAAGGGGAMFTHESTIDTN